MLGIMAEPVEDELVFSALARTRRALGARHGRFMAAVHGTACPSLCATLPGGVAGLCATHSLDGGQRLARLHTNLDHHVRWMSPAAGTALASYVVHGRPRTAWRLALPLPGPGPGPRLRRCPDCTVGDLARHGWPVWYRHHQLPGVMVCSRHLTWLQSTQVPAFRAVRLLECPGGPVSDAEPAPMPDIETALQLARCAEAMGGGQHSPPGLAAARRLFRRSMAECGWLLPGGRASGHLWQALERRYGSSFLAGSGLHPGQPAARRAFAQLWTAPKAEVGHGWPPLLPALLLDFLGLAPGRFLEDCRGACGASVARIAA